MIELIIYDLDGTLIDSRMDIANAVNQTLRDLGLKGLPAERISAFVGTGIENLMAMVLKETGAVSKVGAPLVGALEGAGTRPAPTIKHAVKLLRRHYSEHLLDHTCLYPSVRKVLEFFKDRKQAVITNKPQDFSMKILKGLDVSSYFFRVLGGNQGFPKKPAPEPVLEILRDAGVSKEEAVLVGDSAIDVETGRNAGVKTLAVTYGFGSRLEIENSKPDLILTDFEELIRCPLLKN